MMPGLALVCSSGMENDSVICPGNFSHVTNARRKLVIWVSIL